MSIFLKLVTITFASIAGLITSVSGTEVLQLTGYNEETLALEVQRSLESYFYYDNNGISCGLEDFTIEGYSIIKGTSSAPEKIEVQTTASGPIPYCNGYRSYTCYTFFSKNSEQKWVATSSECNDSLYNE